MISIVIRVWIGDKPVGGTNCSDFDTVPEKYRRNISLLNAIKDEHGNGRLEGIGHSSKLGQLTFYDLQAGGLEKGD